MRHEVIKLTDVAIYPELIKLIESKGEPIFTKSRKGGEGAFLFFDGDEWIRGDEDDIEGEYTPLIDLEFLQKYGENTAPEADKERELLEAFVAQLNADYAATYNDDLDKFLSSLRKPAFELGCLDGVVTDPEQIVYYMNGENNIRGLESLLAKEWTQTSFFITESAANSYRLNNTPAIKLSDMTYDKSTGYYLIYEEVAHNLVNERINGK